MESRLSYEHLTQEQTQANVDQMQKALNDVDVIAQGVSPMQQLGLQYQKDNQDDINELRNILSKNLTYPSSNMAQTHKKANRLGFLDLRVKRQNGVLEAQKISQDSRFCPCCGFVQQSELLTLNTGIKHINHIGISTYMYFQALKHLMFLLVILLLVFSGYAFITNVTTSNMYRSSLEGQQVDNSRLTYQGYLSTSVGSKQKLQNPYGLKTFEVQCWLGVTVIVIWIFCFAVIKFRQKKSSLRVVQDSITASDFTLLFKNKPKSMTMDELQKQLQAYVEQCRKTHNFLQAGIDVKIMKVNQAIPFYLDSSNFDDKDLQKLEKQHQKYKDTFAKWIKFRKQSLVFKDSEEVRKNTYKQFSQLKDQRMMKYQEITSRIITEKKQKNRYRDTVPAFVTFNNTHNKQFLQKMHEKQQMHFMHKWPCFGNQNFFQYINIDSKIKNAKIRPASEPEDIIWTNLGRSTKALIKKKLITYGVTLIILCVSFWTVFGLSNLQFKVQQNQTSRSNQFLSIFISILISFFNIIIKQILRILTVYERNPTFTEAQASLGLKAVLAVLINSILIPIMVNNFFRQNIYGVNGLSEDVFYLAITNSFMSPLLKLVDLSFFYTRILKWHYNKPGSRLYLDQTQLNQYTQLIQFQIGYQYIYIVDLFLFTCFFVSLQPIIPVFAILGMFLMFWAQKYSVFNRCQRPVPGGDEVNTAMYQLIFFGPMMYTLGSFCWSNFLGDMHIGQMPNIVAASLSGFILLIPYKLLITAFMNQAPEPNLVYENDRIFLPSQYDRLNPSTSQQGIKDYANYVNDYRLKLSNKTPQQLNQIQQAFANQYGAGHRKNWHMIPGLEHAMGFRGRRTQNYDQMLVKQLFGGAQLNTINPYMIGAALVNMQPQGQTVQYRQKRGGFRRRRRPNMVVQNWLTSEETNRLSYGHANQQTINPIISLVGYPDNMPQGQIVTYDNPPPPISDGGLNLVFGNLIRSSNRASVQSSQQNHPSNQIPLNIPLNLFGNLLNNNYRRGRRRRQRGERRNRRDRGSRGDRGGEFYNRGWQG